MKIILLTAALIATLSSQVHAIGLEQSTNVRSGRWTKALAALNEADPTCKCILPFKYAQRGGKEILYDSCITVGDTGNNEVPWCPTEVDKNGVFVKGSGKYGKCKDICPNDKSLKPAAKPTKPKEKAKPAKPAAAAKPAIAAKPSKIPNEQTDE